MSIKEILNIFKNDFENNIIEIFSNNDPILFLVKTNDRELILSVQTSVDSETRTWIIANVEKEDLLSMLKNELAIRNVFDNGKNKYIITRTDNGIKILNEKDTPKKWTANLPCPNQYIDSDDGEYDEIIKQIKNL